MDNGTSLDAAKKKLADKLAIDTSWVLGNYKLETDAMVQSTLQGTLRLRQEPDGCLARRGHGRGRGTDSQQRPCTGNQKIG